MTLFTTLVVNRGQHESKEYGEKKVQEWLQKYSMSIFVFFSFFNVEEKKDINRHRLSELSYIGMEKTENVMSGYTSQKAL